MQTYTKMKYILLFAHVPPLQRHQTAQKDLGLFLDNNRNQADFIMIKTIIAYSTLKHGYSRRLTASYQCMLLVNIIIQQGGKCV